jgi:hypothetical protein
MENLNKFLENETIAKVTETLVSSEEYYTVEEIIESLENYCDNPWGKKYEFSIQNEECETIEMEITCNAEREYIFSVDHSGGYTIFSDAKSIVEHINDNIVKWFADVYS